MNKNGWIVLVSLSFLIGGCTSTRFVSTWVDPDATFGRLDGQNIAAFFVSDSESTRRPVEEALAREITDRGGQGLAGYTLLTPEQARDARTAADILTKKGVAAVVTMRSVSEEQLNQTTPDTWYQVPVYHKWGDHWVVSWRSVYEPGETRTDTLVRVETLIYSMASRKLIWTGLSETTNPADTDTLVRDLSTRLDKELAKNGLLRGS